MDRPSKSRRVATVRTLKARVVVPTRTVIGNSVRRLTPVARSVNILRGRMRRRNAITAGYLGVEVKYFDTSVQATTLAAPTTPGNTMRLNPTGGCLNYVSQGDGPTNRDGKKIRMRSLYIKGTVWRSGAEDQPAPQEIVGAYCAVVLDRQTNAAEIAPANVYTNTQGTALNNIALFRNLEYNDRYRILRDQVFVFNAGPQSGYALDKISNGGVVRHFEWYIPLNIDVLFNTVNPSNATIADIVNNAIGFIAVATSSAGNNAVNVSYSSRLRFVG